MKRFVLFVFLTTLCVFSGYAQKDADKIVGNYYAKLAHNEMKVKAFKYKDGYRLQIYWLRDTHNEDGSLKVDKKNPDKSKRSTPMSQVVLVSKVNYHDGIWQDGKVYEPTHGNYYNVELKLCKDNTLEVKGKLGLFHKSMYWKRIN